MSAPGKSGEGPLRRVTRCSLNAGSSVCFGLIILLILGPVLLSPAAITALGGGSSTVLREMSRLFLAPLAELAVVLALLGGTLSASRRQRNLAATTAGLLGAMTLFRTMHLF